MMYVLRNRTYFGNRQIEILLKIKMLAKIRNFGQEIKMLVKHLNFVSKSKLSLVFFFPSFNELSLLEKTLF